MGNNFYPVEQSFSRYCGDLIPEISFATGTWNVVHIHWRPHRDLKQTGLDWLPYYHISQVMLDTREHQWAWTIRADHKRCFINISFFQEMRLSWLLLHLKAWDGWASLAPSTGNRLYIYQDRGQWRPWPPTEHCTGRSKEAAPYTGNCGYCRLPPQAALCYAPKHCLRPLEQSTICDLSATKNNCVLLFSTFYLGLSIKDKFDHILSSNAWNLVFDHMPLARHIMITEDYSFRVLFNKLY